jgi:hypothetical protein
LLISNIAAEWCAWTELNAAARETASSNFFKPGLL